MNLNNASIVPRVRDGQRGQSLVMVMVLLVAFLGAAALVIDLGNLYYSYQQLQAATQAAALAGGQALPSSTATTIATKYSATTGGMNTHSNLSNVTMVSGYPLLKCLTSTGVPCSAPANANAIVVKEQATVRTYFAKIFGVNSLTFTSIATASAPGGGGRNKPFNVMMVVDTTQSMVNNTDPNCSNQTRLACALGGLRTLLGELSPCALSGCGTVTNGNAQHPIDEVGLQVFPGFTSATYAADDICGSITASMISSYTYPVTEVYQVVAPSSDYRTSDTAGSLFASSNIVKAAGGSSGCTGVGDVGGKGTYYASIIYSAQAALISQQSTRATAGVRSQNVLILLSDGDANITSSDETGFSTTSPSYPSTKQQCHQAITAAQAAANAGTWVYAIAYGSTGGGCTTDTSPTITDCATMQNIASSPNAIPDPAKFFSPGGACPNSRSTSTLNSVFTAIGGDLTLAHLLPNNVT